MNKEIKDGKILSLIRKFLVSGVMVGEQIEETEIGTPQGEIFHHFANILLNELIGNLKAEDLNLHDMQMTVLFLSKAKKLRQG